MKSSLGAVPVPVVDGGDIKVVDEDGVHGISDDADTGNWSLRISCVFR